jgi:hypothetical protein
MSLKHNNPNFWDIVLVAGFQKLSWCLQGSAGFQEVKIKQSNPLQEPTNLLGVAVRWKSLLETVADGLSSKRWTGKGTIFFDSALREYQDKVRCGFCEDILRCSSTKVGSEMRLFHDLLTHLNCTMAFTLSWDRILTRIFWEKIPIGDEFFGALDWRRFLAIVVTSEVQFETFSCQE